MNFFDYASSCPPFPEALDVFRQVATDLFGNPSSIHDAGQAARELLEVTRRDFRALCGLDDGRVVLTSGGTEANNTVIRGVMERHPEGRILLAADVHASAWFARERFPKRTDVLRTGRDGKISLRRLAGAASSRTVLCSVLHGNNETGIIHDIEAIGRFCAGRGILFHCDGVQAVGHIPVDLRALPCDFYTFSSHKFGGPRGAGGILLRNAPLAPQIEGGGQEHGLRAGTENVAGFAAALSALKMSCGFMESEIPRLRGLMHVLVDGLKRDVPDTVVNSDLEGGLPGIVSVSFPGAVGHNLAVEMNLAGFAVSSGSACHADRVEPSRVILAMGVSRREALGTVRISMGRHTDEEQVRDLVAVLTQVVERQRALS